MQTQDAAAKTVKEREDVALMKEDIAAEVEKSRILCNLAINFLVVVGGYAEAIRCAAIDYRDNFGRDDL